MDFCLHYSTIKIINIDKKHFYFIVVYSLNIQIMKTIIEQMQDVVNTYNSYKDINKVIKTVVAVHKETGEPLTITSTVEAIKAGINLGDYEVKTITEEPKRKLVEMITGENTGLLLTHYMTIINEFLEIAKHLNSVDPASEFKKKLIAINAKLAKAKGAEVAKLKEARAKLYVGYDVSPRTTYKDIDLYHQILENETLQHSNEKI